MYDIITTVLVLYVVTTLPFRLAFVAEPPLWVFAVEFVLDLWFMIDILVTFRTAYMVDGHLVTNQMAIARNYACSLWFPLDLLSSIPFDWFAVGVRFSGGGGSEEVLRAFKG